uniref:Uncharacterized protein n=1 Tax=Fagus sylvatica TaxID=28930 RepID=A0A2N9G943_FAGSY
MARTQPKARASKLARLVNSEESMVRFRQLYHVPPSIHLAYCHTDNIPVINRDEILLPIMAVVEGGVRFPLHPLLINFLQTVNASPSQVSVNLFKIIMGIVALNRLLGVNLTTREILYVYQYMCPGEKSRTSCHLKARNVNRKLVNGLPDTNKGYDKDYLRVSGDWFMDGSACRSSFGYPDPSRIEVDEKQVDVELVTRVLATNIYVDQRGEPRSTPLLLRYEPQIRSFLEGPTVPRFQEVRVDPSIPFVATPADTTVPSEHPGLIPTGQVSEMAPPINPFKLMGKKPKKLVTDTPVPEQIIQATVNQEPPQPLPIIHDIDESDHGEGLAPRRTRGRSEGPSILAEGRTGESPSIPVEGTSSNFEAWVPELLFGDGPIFVQDTVLDESESDLSAHVAHGLARVACLPGDMNLWDSMNSGRIFRHVTRGMMMATQGILSMEARVFKMTEELQKKDEVEERARKEMANRTQMEVELNEMREKVRKLESECILSIGKAREEGKEERKVLGKEEAMDEAGLKNSDDEADEKDDEDDEGDEEEGGPDKVQESSQPELIEKATDVPGPTHSL